MAVSSWMEEGGTKGPIVHGGGERRRDAVGADW
jgi:hypothetical protein